MNSALLKYPIEIYKLVTVQTPYGTIESTYEYDKTTRAHIMFNSESQVTANGEIWYPTTRTFVVRTSNSDVVEQDRIKWDGKWWNILSINKNDFYGNIEIQAEKVNT